MTHYKTNFVIVKVPEKMFVRYRLNPYSLVSFPQLQATTLFRVSAKSEGLIRNS